MSETNAVIEQVVEKSATVLSDAPKITSAVVAGEALVAPNTALSDRVSALENLTANLLSVLADMFPNHAVAQVAQVSAAQSAASK